MTALTDRPGADRIVTIDAVRGFALLGIIGMHMVEQYLGSPPPASRAAVEVPLVDQIGTGFAALFLMGKFFAMFSLLFGMSFFIQMDRAAARGQSFEGRFVWRLAVLFVIGMAHHLVYRGDILAIYAALGLVLLLFYRVSDRWLLVTAAAVLFGMPRLLQASWIVATGSDASLALDDQAALEHYWDTLKAGSPVAIGLLNLRDGVMPKLDFQFSFFGRGYQTLGLFLVGLYIARRRWHERIETFLPAIRRLTWWSIGVAVAALLCAAGLIAVAAATGQLPNPDSPAAPGQPEPVPPLWLIVGGFTVYDVFNLAMMAAYLCVFLRLYHRAGAQRLLRRLAPVGQTALTVYVAQSVIGGLIFYGYGLNLLGELGAVAGLLLAGVIFLGQVIVANLWLGYFRFGPLEWLWRSATYLQVQPLVRRRATPLPQAV